MPLAADYYPPGPRVVPDDLTEPLGNYRQRAGLLLVSLVAFFLLYIALVIGSALLTLVCLVLYFPLGLLGTFFFGMLFLFLVKGFFKHRPVQKSIHVQVTEEQHPKLFTFIEMLCEETGAPLPHKVVLTHEVNACVFYHDTALGLFLPGKKNLLIGLGLVNVLTLGEFKAVLAHEFGHFAQSSMKLDQYLYQANVIITQMVYGRDWFDDFVERLCLRRDRWVFLGWVCSGVLWLFRKGLEGCYYGMNLLSRSLSREMEFNADLVAVSVCGSDAIVHALARLDFATQSLDHAFFELKAAADHGLFTSDLFHHQNHSASYLRKLRKDPTLGEPPVSDQKGVLVTVFEEDDDGGVPPMWATHPSNFDRERNAKAHFVRCPIDDRSPWILFDDPIEVRERVSRKFYRQLGLDRDVDLDDAKRVQKFIDAERAETTYDERYGGLYDVRAISPGKIPSLVRQVRKDARDAEDLAKAHRRLYNAPFRKRMKGYTTLREELRVLLGLRNGTLKPRGETFKFRGKRYEVEDVKKLLKKVQRELEEKHEEFSGLDREVFMVHFQMCKELEEDMAEEMIKRYVFHLGVQDIDRELTVEQVEMESALAMLTRQAKPSYNDIERVQRTLRNAHAALEDCMDSAHGLRLPRLKNMKEGARLGSFLLRRDVVRRLRPGANVGQWINRLLEQYGQVRDRIRRIHFKSLGGILALQEAAATKWKVEQASAVTTELVEEEEEVVTEEEATFSEADLELEPVEPAAQAKQKKAALRDEDDPVLLPLDDAEKPKAKTKTVTRNRHTKI